MAKAGLKKEIDTTSKWAEVVKKDLDETSKWVEISKKQKLVAQNTIMMVTLEEDKWRKSCTLHV